MYYFSLELKQKVTMIIIHGDVLLPIFVIDVFTQKCSNGENMLKKAAHFVIYACTHGLLSLVRNKRKVCSTVLGCLRRAGSGGSLIFIGHWVRVWLQYCLVTQ